MQEKAFLGLSAAGFHRTVYYEWGSVDAPRTVVCVHGLTRNGRDFDFLAQELTATARVVCPDVVGRGRSDWLPMPELYGYPQYLADMTALLARLDVESIDWVGTSMGGLIGMMLAAQPRSPIRRMVLSDVGPFVPKEALERIAVYVGADPSLPDAAALEAVLREVSAPFALSDAHWRHLATHSVRRKPDGSVGFAYDPAVSHALKTQPIEDVDVWPIWDAVRCPVMVLHGEDSDILLRETAEEMGQRGPKAKVVHIAGVGHAPMMMDDAQIGLVRDWLNA